MKELIGRSISNIYINPDKDRIVFQCFNRFISYDVEGDCCSVSWIEHISGLPKINESFSLHTYAFNFQVDSVTPIECRNIDVAGKECVEIFGYRLSGPYGTIVIEMRNESNGYYSGYITDPLIHDKLDHLFDGDYRQILEDF